MYAYFNEYSVCPHVPADAVLSAMDGFVDTCCMLLKYGVKKIACNDGPGSIMLSDTETVHSYCVKNFRNDKVRLLISNFTKPYLEDDSQEEALFVGRSYSVTISDCDGRSQTISDPMGLASAHLYESFVVSVASTEFWKSAKTIAVNVSDGARQSVVHVRNVVGVDDMDDDVRNLIAAKTERKWVKSDLRPESKSISLSSDHHGNDKLKAFAKNSLRPLDYFVEVSTSLDYVPRFGHFVRYIYTDTNQIDVVLHGTDKGYSMRIKTTAQSELQLRQMALELESRFGTGDVAFAALAEPVL